MNALLLRPVRRALLASLLVGCGASSPPAPSTAQATPEPVAPRSEPASLIVPAEDVEWQQLNPARGDASPMAATLYGDRNGAEATGFLFHAVDGFSSPPHIHNVSYRAVVIRGLLHNDDADAAPMWMPPGSFWTQPRGASHITAARGDDVLAYVEIDEGPYLVRPVDQAFETDEVPINVDVSNLVWLPVEGADARMAYLWGAVEAGAGGGAFVDMPSGASLILTSGGAPLQAVVIAGRGATPSSDGTVPLDLGSYFRTEGPPVSWTCGDTRCVLYVRSTGRLGVTRR